ncbi:hypothetical protein N008_11895 [Hymenobacter sp. APR13]|nr:hypothetical protein N008_11895 [Hymenobacter sp. APR13]
MQTETEEEKYSCARQAAGAGQYTETDGAGGGIREPVSSLLR